MASVSEPGDNTKKNRQRTFTNSSGRYSEYSDISWKSDIRFLPHNMNQNSSSDINVNYQNKTAASPTETNKDHFKNVCGENKSDLESAAKSSESVLITDSHLDRLECEYKSSSQKLQTDESTLDNSLDAMIECYKLKVKDILEHFFTSVEDFEYFKNKFNDIVAKNKEEAFNDIEDFITDIIQRIKSSENLLDKTDDKSTAHIRTKKAESEKVLQNLNSIVQNLKMRNVSHSDIINSNVQYEQIFPPHSPYEIFRINNKKVLSEVNVKSKGSTIEISKYASAGDFKKIEIKHTESQEDKIKESNIHVSDREIPVKVSNARKDIHADNDFTGDNRNLGSQSFISKICNFICKRFRKT